LRRVGRGYTGITMFKRFLQMAALKRLFDAYRTRRTRRY